jgi:branched-chain amino acid transport system ATP-binding protein
MLSVEKIDLKYNRVKVIEDVSFRVEKGEIVALIGGNGNGKSTILKGISGILHPAAGSITFEGQDITRREAHRIVELGISCVPEGRRLFPYLSVYKNLLLGAFLVNDKTEIEHRLDHVFGIFPILKERAVQKASTLSGGEQQMLAIGRALMSTPRILLLDEPSLGLAPILVHLIFDIIQEISRQGVAILLVEQNAHQALTLASRGYVLETGRIAAEGSSEELTSDRRIQEAYLGGSALKGR